MTDLMHEQWAEAHPAHYQKGVLATEVVVRGLGRRRNGSSSFPVIIDGNEQSLGLNHLIQLELESVYATEPDMTSEERWAVWYGAQASREECTVTIRGLI